MAEEPGGINYDWQLAGGVRVQFLEFLPQFVLVFFTVYLLHELKPGQTMRDKAKITPNKASEERKCQRTEEVTDPPLAAAAWES